MPFINSWIRRSIDLNKPAKWLAPSNIRESPVEVIHEWYDLENSYCKNRLAPSLLWVALMSCVFFALDIYHPKNPASVEFAGIHRFGLAILLLGVAIYIRRSTRPWGELSYVLYKGLVVVVTITGIIGQYYYSSEYPDRLRLYPPLYVAILVYITRVGPTISSLVFLIELGIWLSFNFNSPNTLQDANFQAIGALFVWIFQAGIKRDADMLIAKSRARSLELAQVESDRKRTEKKLARFLPLDFVKSVMDGKSEINMKPRLSHLTVMFVDIVGFTSLTSKHGEHIVPVLNSYLSQTTSSIFSNHGVVDKFIGDAVMGFFGGVSDQNLRSQCEAALKCSKEILLGMHELNNNFREQGLPEIKVRIGIHCGSVLIGEFGSEQRSDFTVIGSVVNMASRIESAADPMSVFMSSEVARNLPDNAVAARGEFNLRGIGKADLYCWSEQLKLTENVIHLPNKKVD